VTKALRSIPVAPFRTSEARLGAAAAVNAPRSKFRREQPIDVRPAMTSFSAVNKLAKWIFWTRPAELYRILIEPQYHNCIDALAIAIS
jgi:hypothetical protein